MEQVYVLWHHYPDDPDDGNAKLLGVYSSEEIARQRIEKTYKRLPGFSRGEGAFAIDAYEIDRDHWQEGYFKTGGDLDHE